MVTQSESRSGQKRPRVDSEELSTGHPHFGGLLIERWDWIGVQKGTNT